MDGGSGYEQVISELMKLSACQHVRQIAEGCHPLKASG